MSDEKTNAAAASKLAKLLSGSFKSADKAKYLEERRSLLADNQFHAMSGSIDQAGPLVDGTFNVQFDNGTTGYATLWPQWAYEAAREAVLHGKKVIVTYTGDAPYGYNLLGVLIQNSPA